MCFLSDVLQGRYWAGWYDEPQEGTYVNANSGESLESRVTYNPWYLGEPNGDKLENCAMVYVARNAWNDVQCKHLYCSFCELERAPDIQIRGLIFFKKKKIDNELTHHE